MSKFQFKAFSTLTLKNAQDKLIEHAKKVGLYENFGQEVIHHLKSKYGYDTYSYDDKDKEVVRRIDWLDHWCMSYNF